MLVVSVELLHGTFRGDPDGTANTGGLSRGEWPPSPSRLFAALVAADGTGRRCRVTDGSELHWFVRLPPPVIHADADPRHQPLEPRYVVVSPRSPRKSAHMEYVGRTGTRIRPGYRVTPRHPHVVYRWDTEVPPAVFDALRRRAARVGYLGAADTPVRVRISDSMPDVETSPAGVYQPDPAGDLAISVPREGDLELLDQMFDAWSTHGPGVGRSQFPALRHRVGYRSPAGRAAVDRGGVVAWLRLGRAVAGRRVSRVTAVFKDAVLSRFQAIHGEPPPVLHGHGFRRKGFDLARYLALPDVGDARSHGHIHGLALWLPPGSDAPERARIREAAFSVSRLHGHGVDVSVRPADETGTGAATPQRWTRTARCWTSAFPVVHERRVPVDLQEVARWCRHAGLPAPGAFRSARAPFVPGGVDLAPVEVNRPGRGGRPYSHLMVWFDVPVTGPVVLGSARQRGLGLCVDVAGDAEVNAV
ncbi:MAG: type I-U CRISPR-associated protein Csb2 [Gemmatimonadota bacterium]|nr:type I-U CRISPR-associated protein Csb2 [Gemmatimonadota bacterium]